MSTMELVFNMLAEATTTELSRTRRPETFSKSQKNAKEGGETAGDAREVVEKRLGHSIITSKNSLDMPEHLALKEKQDSQAINNVDILPMDEEGDLNLLLDYIKRHGSLSISEAVNFVAPNISRRTLQRRLKKLLDAGKIEAHGATNRKRYILAKNYQKD